MEFPSPPRIKPPAVPKLGEIFNKPLEVAAAAVSRMETDLTQIATDLESIGQPLLNRAPPPAAQTSATPEKGTACLQCTEDHLSTIVGALNEAMRFAREGGTTGQEVQKRLAIATDELNICERIDLAPDKTAALGPEEKELATWVLPLLRSLRYNIKKIKEVDELEQVAAGAIQVRTEYSQRYSVFK
jgi:hypothetical protein